jgi:hypothetical protein
MRCGHRARKNFGWNGFVTKQESRRLFASGIQGRPLRALSFELNQSPPAEAGKITAGRP